MNEKIVITGIGVLSPIGIGREEYLGRTVSGENGISPGDPL